MRLIFRSVRDLLLLAATYALFTLVSNVQAQVIVPIPDVAGAAHDIADVNGRTWLATADGAYRVDGDIARRVTPEGVEASRILQLRDAVYATTEDGLYRVEGDSVQRISEIRLNVETVFEVDGRLWLLAQQGLSSDYDAGRVYCLEGDELRQITADDLRVRKMELAGGQLWLLTGSLLEHNPIYRIDGDKTTLIGGNDLNVTAVKSVGATAWLLADGRAYRVDGDTLQPAFADMAYVNDLVEVDNRVWVASKDGLYVVEDGSARRIFGAGINISTVRETAGRVWIETTIQDRPGETTFGFRTGPLYCALGEHVFKVSDKGMDIEAVEEIGGMVWVIAEHGAYVLEGERLRLVSDVDKVVFGLENVGGRAWLKTDSGACAIDSGGVRSAIARGLTIREITKVGDKVWLATNAGAFRYDEDIHIAVAFKQSHSLWKSVLGWFLPGEVWVSGMITPHISYARRFEGTDPYPETISRRFELILETDVTRFGAAIEAKQFSAAEGFERSLDSGGTVIYAYVRDRWGNVTSYAEPVTVLPEGPVMAGLSAIALFFFFSLILFFIFLTAPFSDFSQRLLMDPAPRVFRPFSFIPSFIAVVPRVKQHILLRYLHGVLSEENFIRWEGRFVMPEPSLMPERIAALLREKRVLLLLGESGKGKSSLLEYLTLSFARWSSGEQAPDGLVPVFVSLSLYQEEKDPFRMFCKELARLGQFTDDDLNLRFLHQGGFVIFFDGINEANETMRNQVAEFVALHKKKNGFCLSSQERYPKFAGYETVLLEGFGPPEVTRLITETLGREKAEEVLARFTEGMFRTYKTPQDLMFAIRLLRSGKVLPPLKNELYKAVLSPILAEWEDQGRTEHVLALYRRAYEMVCLSDFIFNQGDLLPPSDIQNRLVEEKLMVCRDGGYRFQHESVRAYLASRYFAGRWASLLTERPTLDINWQTVLEFTLSELGNAQEAEAFTLMVLRKNEQVALNLVEKLRTTYPHLCEGWANRFIAAHEAPSSAQA